MDTDLDRDIAELRSLILEIITDLEKRFAAHLAQHGLTRPQFFVLRTLAENDGHCQIGQIAREHHLTNATLSGLVNRMESMSPPLVRRERSLSDRRSVMVHMTAAGQSRFDAIEDELVEQLRTVLSLIDREERKDIIARIRLYMQIATRLFPFNALDAG